jgi:NAD-dependent DNA ligase
MRINLRDDDTVPQSKTITKKKFPINLTHSSYCITGTVPGYTRSEFAKFMERTCNAHMDKQVSNSTKALIIGIKPGKDKLKEAKLRNIPTIEISNYIME